MYVKSSVNVDSPIREAIAAFVARQDTWFPHRLEQAGAGSTRQLAAVGFEVAGFPIAKRVEVILEPLERRPDWLRQRIEWRPVGAAAALLPTLRGEIHLEPRTFNDTRITLTGGYDPPLGAAGRLIDAAAMHHVAEATFKDLLESVAAELQLPVSLPSPI